MIVLGMKAVWYRVNNGRKTLPAGARRAQTKPGEMKVVVLA
jgi:hypothetical protein